MVSVAAAIIVNNDKVLLAKRAASKFLGGYWELPGGKIEAGETPEMCLHRELAEELEIEITIIEYLTEQVFDYGEFVVCLKVFICSLNSGRFKLNDHDQIEWVERHHLLNFNLAPADIDLVAYYLKKTIK